MVKLSRWFPMRHWLSLVALLALALPGFSQSVELAVTVQSTDGLPVAHATVDMWCLDADRFPKSSSHNVFGKDLPQIRALLDDEDSVRLATNVQGECSVSVESRRIALLAASPDGVSAVYLVDLGSLHSKREVLLRVSDSLVHEFRVFAGDGMLEPDTEVRFREGHPWEFGSADGLSWITTFPRQSPGNGIVDDAGRIRREIHSSFIGTVQALAPTGRSVEYEINMGTDLVLPKVLVMRPVRRISGVVTGPLGDGLVGADVYLIESDGAVTKVGTSNEQGAFDADVLVEDDCILVARDSGERGRYVQREVDIFRVPHSGGVSPVRLEMLRASRLSGRLASSDGRALIATIMFVPSLTSPDISSAAPEVREALAKLLKSTVAVSKSSGQFSIRGIATTRGGSLLVQATVEEGRRREWRIEVPPWTGVNEDVMVLDPALDEVVF